MEATRRKCKMTLSSFHRLLLTIIVHIIIVQGFSFIHSFARTLTLNTQLTFGEVIVFVSSIHEYVIIRTKCHCMVMSTPAPAAASLTSCRWFFIFPFSSKLLVKCKVIIIIIKMNLNVCLVKRQRDKSLIN